MHTIGKTPAFRDARGELVPGSIAEIAYRKLGGVDQWVMIRGERITNPALILLHGGPGFSETGIFRRFNAPLEKAFTVVYWDQRGAGKSFDPAIPRSSMTLEQFVADLDELVEVVRTRLGAPKVTIFGHSWGSVFGALYAARFPDKVAAYVASGQIGHWPKTEATSYAYAIETAERRHHRRAIRALRRIGPPPYPAKSVFVERTWIQILDGQLGPRGLWSLAKLVLGAQESSILELPDAYRGFRWTMDVMWPEVSTLDVHALAPALRMPTFFFLGRNDHFVPADASMAYVDALIAPSKRVEWFEHSGHEPFMDEPALFNARMVELVRPVVA